MGDFIFDTNQQFFYSRAGYDYTIPAESNLEQLNIEIDKIPLLTSPSVFGLHSNAEISYFTNSAKELWLNTIKMQTSDGGASGGVNREDIISTVATDVQGKLPEEYDYIGIRKQFDTPSPTQVVLLQELERFNILIQSMASSLFDLKRALNGEIGMSQ